MTAILGVHGVGNDRPLQSDTEAARTLATIWKAALIKTVSASAVTELCVAYYAPHLRAEVTQGPEDPDVLGSHAQDMIRAWVGLLDPPIEISAGRATVPLRFILEWVADHFGLDNRLTRTFVTRFFPELAVYFDPLNTYPRVRSRNVFLQAFTELRPRIVVAHSLGSVVAYEALWSRPDLQVDLLLTLGSPLGMQDVVFPRLEPLTTVTGWGQRPPGVRNWTNISDTGDLIAIPRQLTQRFRGIDHEHVARIDCFDFHKVINYLSNPVIAAALVPYLD